MVSAITGTSVRHGRNAHLGEVPFGEPQIVRLLHAQPQTRTIADELPDSQRHRRRDALVAPQNRVNRLARHANSPGEGSD
jgi:hypothetical protein